MTEPTPRQHTLTRIRHMQTETARLLGTTEDERVRDVVRLARRNIAEAVVWFGHDGAMVDAFALGMTNLTLDLAGRHIRVVERALLPGGRLPD